MITQEQAWNDQQDLGLLCSDKKPKEKEIYIPNSFYGDARVLKEYSGYRSGPLKIVIPHGPPINDTRLNVEDLEAPLPAIFYYRSEHKTVYQNNSDKVTFPSSTPFNYALELMKDFEPPKRNGTLFFPPHSTGTLIANVKDEYLCEALTKLRDHLKPVTVCIYWRDHQLGRHKTYLERGFPIVSAGHRLDEMFLCRLIHLFRSFQYCCSTHLGSHIPYSIKAGLSFFLMKKVEYEVEGSIEDKRLRFYTVSTAKENLWRKLFEKQYENPTPEQINFSDHQLGTNNLHSPKALKSILHQVERLDNWSFRIPHYYKRGITLVKNRLKGLIT